MKKVYEGNYLTIFYENQNNLFVQNWINPPETIAQFKSEMLEYVALYKVYKPKNVLWLQEDFKLKMDTEAQYWIEEHVNKPCLEYGNKKCAFVVSKDVLAHISVINSFEDIKSCIEPRHFSTETEARTWLTETLDVSESPQEDFKILYDGVDDNGDLVLKVSSKNIKQSFKTIHKSIEQDRFIQENKNKLELLTKREKEILGLISKHKKHQEIAGILFISLHTVRTHWKNIKLKLNFKNDIDLINFVVVFFK